MGRIIQTGADSGFLADRAPEPKVAPQSMVGVVTSADFEEKILKSTGKVVVDFSAIWCGPCYALAPVLEQVAQEHKNEVKIYSCNIDDWQDLAASFGVQAVPTLFLFEDGKIVHYATGAMPKAQIEAFIGL